MIFPPVLLDRGAGDQEKKKRQKKKQKKKTKKGDKKKATTRYTIKTSSITFFSLTMIRILDMI